MAIPKIDWNLWSASAIKPLMRAIIHFQSGDVVCTDDDIATVSFNVPAFDSTYQLFGPPKPATGSITFIDYEQQFNPVYNNELTAGIKIELFLGLDNSTGANLVSGIRPTIPVTYNGVDKYAVPFTTVEPLEQGAQYKLFVAYSLPDGTPGSLETEGSFEDLFVAPNNWPDSNSFALVANYSIEVHTLVIDYASAKEEPYGVFYSEEWTYDSNGAEASVTIVDKMSDALLLDNRRDADKPGVFKDAQIFLVDLLSLYDPISNTLPYNGYLLRYAFYEQTQAATINGLVVALGKMLFFMPDGTQTLSDYTGYYATGITLTDNDVESYEIKQSSSVSMDSALVYANLPTEVESKELATFSNIILASNDVIPFSIARITSVDYLALVSSEDFYPTYSYTIADVTYDPDGTNLGVTFDTFKVLGKTIESSALPVYNVVGSLPYEIKDNPYIQTKEQAQYLVDILDSFIGKDFRVITVTLRGCYGLWVGAKLNINSGRYAINAEYVVINLAFRYDGTVSTKLTLQRIN